MSLNFNGFVVQYLHDQKVGVIHIQLNTVKEILDLVHLGVVALNQVFVASTYHHLTSHCDSVILLVSNRALITALVVEY